MNDLLARLRDSGLTAWSVYDCSKYPHKWRESGWEATGWIAPMPDGFKRDGNTPEDALESLLNAATFYAHS